MLRGCYRLHLFLFSLLSSVSNQPRRVLVKIIIFQTEFHVILQPCKNMRTFLIRRKYYTSNKELMVFFPHKNYSKLERANTRDENLRGWAALNTLRPLHSMAAIITRNTLINNIYWLGNHKVLYLRII